MGLTKSNDAEGKAGGFFKEKILKNASFAYGIALGIIAQKHLIGVGGVMVSDGIILSLIGRIFS